jgi:hypothetical protein
VLSVDAVHETSTLVGDDAVAVVPVGVEGGLVSTVQAAETGGGAGPLGAVVATVNVCATDVNAVKLVGLVHAVAVPPSSVQVNVAPATLLWNANVADVAFVRAAGLLSSAVTGAALRV